MRKILALAGIGAVGLVGVAQADKPPHPAHPSHPAHPASCTPHAVGYNAVGTLVSASLAPAAGHDRYSGTITVDVTRANHHATTGSQTFTLIDARAAFHRGVDATAPAVGSQVSLHGKITELRKGCATAGFSPTTTIGDVDVRTAKP